MRICGIRCVKSCTKCRNSREWIPGVVHIRYHALQCVRDNTLRSRSWRFCCSFCSFIGVFLKLVDILVGEARTGIDVVSRSTVGGMRLHRLEAIKSIILLPWLLEVINLRSFYWRIRVISGKQLDANALAGMII
jgi:hypothetical protein